MESDPARRPFPDRIVGTGQPPGEVGVEALDSFACPTDPAGRPRPDMVGIDEGIPFRCISGVGLGDPIDADFCLGGPDAPGRLEPTHRFAERWIAQPVAGGHRRAVIEERGVRQNCGGTVLGPDDDLESTGGDPTQQFGDALDVPGRVPRGGHRQNSSVERTRVQNPPPDAGAVGADDAGGAGPLAADVDAVAGRPGSGDMFGACAGDTRG